MWQELIVGVILLVCAGYIGKLLWKKFALMKSDAEPSCQDCSSCGEGSRVSCKNHPENVR
ncbi:FeoB-associated Cys-rich membrane protein [Desulfomonile tiedjei]|uniref:FeoB-associated Cys-rich membrane protein n=1 Tax=Desulfomonile tiedjei TaxID=2358 RepID=UPI00059E91DA